LSLTSKTTTIIITTITFRISKKYKKTLKSKNERISLNTIENKIFGEYIKWQQFIDKFGTIVLSKEAFLC
jgi:hypothetical protein